jgi:hypothetical protein
MLWRHRGSTVAAEGELIGLARPIFGKPCHACQVPPVMPPVAPVVHLLTTTCTGQ